MSVLPSPQATRLGRVRWLDARLVLGVVLVLGSVGLGARVVAQAGRTLPVWTTTRDLAAGSVLTAGDLRAQQVRLGAAAAPYLRASESPPIGAVVVRDLHAGELVPRAAVRPDPQVGQQALVTVPVKQGHFPPGLQRGQRVDVYLTPPQPADPHDPSAAQPPRRVLAAVTVAAVQRDSGGLGSVGRTAVILAVPRAEAVPAADLAAPGAAETGASGSPSGTFGVADAVADLIAAFQRGEVDLVAVGSSS